MSTGGVYKVEYRVEFTGGHLRGNVPALVVSSKTPPTPAVANLTARGTPSEEAMVCT